MNTGAATATSFGPGSGPVIFSNVVCSGNEFKLFECGNTVPGNIGSCTHTGVVCQAGELF